ncbi:unnamed protein product [Absidia cylindrospora]
MDDNANSTSEEHYAGWNELRRYIAKNSHPDFKTFVSNDSRNIALWAETDKLKTTAKALHQTWVSRYRRQAKDLTALMKPKYLAFDKQTWTLIAKLTDANKITDLQFTTESVKVLGSYSKQATVIVIPNINKGKGKRQQQQQRLEEITHNHLKRTCYIL